jgi:hypothetical protein
MQVRPKTERARLRSIDDEDPVMEATSPAWFDKASCRGSLPFRDLAFRMNDVVDPAVQAVCRSCPAQLVCLRHADEVDELVGTWGGVKIPWPFVGRARRLALYDAERAWIAENRPELLEGP